MAKIIYIGWLVLASFFIQGCKTVAGLKMGNDSVSQDWNKFVTGQPDIQSLEMKRAQLVATFGGNTQKSSANIFIIKDSAIHISVQPFPGMEMFKVEFSKDTIIVFNKMNSQRYEAAYRELSDLIGVPVNLQTWQSLLSHYPISLIQPAASISKIHNKDITDFKIKNDNWEQLISVDKTDNYLGFKIKNIHEKKSLQMDYTDFRKSEEIFFPFIFLLDVQNKNLMLKFEVNLSRMTYNKKPELRFEDKNKYMLVPISTLIK